MNTCPKCGITYEGNFCPNGCDSNIPSKRKKNPKLIIAVVIVVLLIGVVGGIIAVTSFNSDMDSARECIASGNFGQAEEILNKQMDTNGSQDVIYLLYADLYIAKEDYSGAINVLNEGVDRCSSSENLKNKISEIKNKYATELEEERVQEEREKAESEKEADRKRDETDAEKLGISIESFYDVYDKLSLVGLTESDVVLYKLDDWADGKRVGTDYETAAITIYLNESGQVQTIRSGDVLFYEDGEVKGLVKDFVIEDSMRANLKSWATEAVQKCLKSPASAEFPGGFLTPYEDWSFSRDGSTYTVSSYVDSQNSFGAMIRSYFTAKFECGESTTLTYLSIDDQIIVG